MEEYLVAPLQKRTEKKTETPNKYVIAKWNVCKNLDWEKFPKEKKETNLPKTKYGETPVKSRTKILVADGFIKCLRRLVSSG